MKDNEEFEKIAKYIIEKCIFIWIETENNLEDSINIFNSLNGKGMSLTSGEIVLSLFYSKLSNDENKRKDFENRWRKIREDLKHLSLTVDSILTYYMTIKKSKKGDLSSNKGLLNFFEKQFNSDDFDSLSALEVIEKNIEQLLYVKENTLEYWTISHLNSNFKPFVASFLYYKLNLDKDDFRNSEKMEEIKKYMQYMIKLSSLLESKNFHFSHSEFKVFLQNANVSFSATTKDINSLIDDIKEHIKQNFKDYKERIKYEFENKPYKSSGLIYLKEFFLHKQKSDEEIKSWIMKIEEILKHKNDKINIEHIVPSSRITKSDGDYNDPNLLNKIGNKILLEESINKSIKDNSIDFKIKEYRKSAFYSPKVFSDWLELNKNMDEKDIKKQLKYTEEKIERKTESEVDEILSFIFDEKYKLGK